MYAFPHSFGLPVQSHLICSIDMLKFLEHTRTSMISCRRSHPIPQDWVYALARLRVTSSDLDPHVEVPLAPDITQPLLVPYPPDSPVLPAAESVLGPKLLPMRQKYIPQHLPPIPSKHTWMKTASYPDREEDARKIREKATEEGVQAEKAMRKLMTSAVHAKSTNRDRRSAKDQRVWDEAMKEVLRLDEEQRIRDEAAEAMEYEADGLRGGVSNNVGEAQPDVDSKMLVNYEEKFWRPTGQKRKH
jgi:transcription initiation factor TFIID subunit 8